MQMTEQRQTTILQRAMSGAVLIVISVAMLVISWNYPMGQLTQMGPGYVPHFVALAIGVLGIVILISDLRTMRHADADDRSSLRGLVFVAAAVVVFATLIDWLGLVPAMFLAVSISMLADSKVRPVSILIYSSIVTFCGWLLFIVALGLPLSAFWR